MVLDRMDLIYESQTDGRGDLDGWRIANVIFLWAPFLAPFAFRAGRAPPYSLSPPTTLSGMERRPAQIFESMPPIVPNHN